MEEQHIYKNSIQKYLTNIPPREKLVGFGVDCLSDKELLSVIIGSGTKTSSVNKIATGIVNLLDEKNVEITLEDLLKIEGLGNAKAMSIISILELGRRLFVPRKRKIVSPMDIIPVVSHYSDRDQECFLVHTLNGAHELVSSRVVSVGLVNRTLVHPREVFKQALIDNAVSVIVAHNHPSGNVEPSKEDILVTQNLVEAGKTLAIGILDHIIFSVENFYSFAEHGKL